MPIDFYGNVCLKIGTKTQGICLHLKFLPNFTNQSFGLCRRKNSQNKQIAQRKGKYHNDEMTMMMTGPTKKKKQTAVID